MAELKQVHGQASFLAALRLADKHVLIVGGGKEATGRIFFALDADARVTIVAPQTGLTAAVQQRIDLGQVRHLDRNFDDADLDLDGGVYMVLSCIDDHEESARIAQLCRARSILVNCADIPDLCDFYFMAQYREGPLQIGISTNGCGPRLAARLRSHVVSSLPGGPEQTCRAVERIGNLRKRVRERHADMSPESVDRRMRWFSRLCDQWSFEDMAKMTEDEVSALVGIPVSIVSMVGSGVRALPLPLPLGFGRRAGKLILVGAGPGPADLLTLRAAEALKTADVVVSDQLVSPSVLKLIRKSALRFVPRKAAGQSDRAQLSANDMCLEELKKGRTVVRLKGGDPFLFGRGGEEVAFFREQGYEPTVVPGISSCIAVPEAAMIPVTHRGVADQVLVLSGRGENGAYPNIPPYYEKRSTVVLMSVLRLKELVQLFSEQEYPSATPVAVIENGTLPEQRVVTGTLETIVEIVAAAAVGSPSLIVVGESIWALNSRPESAEAVKPAEHS
ncbi:tetrapyrrole methylase [Polychytrium aggregatum]|uniref:tetrapyrrole methylase n=1 Tax=Polychytrium aggregatum TaxID=110093 RepID=UPI0022FE1736|nr:tetrapyrrole methylase [Polychytrium aggregatum]KAI9203488.1 tetrapyrrole methylase [Polychytrium aggregatum]